MYKHNEDLMIFEQDNNGILQTIDGTLHILNSTAYKVYSICEGKSDGEIIDIMKSNYIDVDYQTLYTDVSEILNLMLDKGIILLQDEVE